MKSFLDSVAEEILKSEANALRNITIVLPNKRAKIFLSKALVQISKKPIISPEILDIEEFINDLSPWENIEGLELFFEFYEAYRSYYSKHKNIEIKDFDEFIKWAPIILKDFEDIDKFLLNPKEVFHYLSEVKAIEQWNLENSSSQFIKNYKEYFSSLAGLHNELNYRLSQKKRAYGAMKYRHLAENIQEYKHLFTNKIIFAGFNALTPAEEKIIQFLLKEKDAKIYWDTDNYYMKSGMEAGEAMRKNKKNFPDFQWENDFYKIPKQIEIIEAAGNTSQMETVSQIIKEIIETNPQTDLTRMAVVLNENNLIFPLLDSLPQNINELNVSIGIPLNQMQTVQIFTQISQLFNQLEQYGKYKATSLIEFLRSPYLQTLITEEQQEEIKKLIDEIFKFGSKLIPKTQILNSIEHLPEFIKKIFLTEAKPAAVIQLFSEIIEELSNKNLPITENISLMKLEKVIEQIYIFNKQTSLITSFKTLELIFLNLLKYESLYFEGEPLSGLQIMGLLETRLLDFDYLIITSMNEGVLPKGKNIQSLIPIDIKTELGLPTYRNQTSIMAYHFYRLLQRTKKVFLIYNNHSQGLNNGEASRFLIQLSEELPKYQPQTQIITKKTVTQSVLLQTPEKILKSEKIMQKLYEKTETGISPSFLNAYIYDPIEFVKSHLLKLNPPEELIEGIPANIYGTIVHNTLEELYKNYEGKFLQLQDIQKFKNEYKKYIIQHFLKETGGEQISGGKKHIALQIINKNIYDILLTDEQLLLSGKNIKIHEIESKLSHKIQVNNKEIIIKGFVDRIDEVDGQLRIIDYKTGNVEENQLNFNSDNDDMDVLITESKYSKILQLLIYIWLYKKGRNFTEPAIGGILSTRKFKKGLHNIKIDKNNLIDAKILKNFEVSLQKLLAEILDPTIAFEVKK